MADFNAEDKNSWYFGLMSREETNNLLQAERDSGVFLVRDSTTIKGDFVLCVKEDQKVAHYIINKIQVGGLVKFRIGDQEFTSLPALLNFYKTHYLDITSLIRPDPDDLGFEKGEILYLVRKDEEQWWTCCNSQNKMGLVPATYIERYTPGEANDRAPPPLKPEPSTQPSTPPNGIPAQQVHRKLPAWASVIKTRIPSAYDRSQLTLQVGNKVLVTAMNISGQWEGEVNGNKGSFPFTHVKFLDDLAEEP